MSTHTSLVKNRTNRKPTEIAGKTNPEWTLEVSTSVRSMARYRSPTPQPSLGSTLGPHGPTPRLAHAPQHIQTYSRSSSKARQPCIRTQLPLARLCNTMCSATAGRSGRPRRRPDSRSDETPNTARIARPDETPDTARFAHPDETPDTAPLARPGAQHGATPLTRLTRRRRAAAAASRATRGVP